ncbi:MAG: DoxX family protein [Chryseobacterium sp.]|nr:DoxX family protein [Chryseobacterium sp.]
MKLNTISFNSKALSIALLFLRIFIGFAMFTHGYPKLQKLLSGEEVQFFNLFGIGAKASLALAIFAELICSIFLILGLFTRTFSIPLIITMFVAGFLANSSGVFADRELAFVYLAIYILILVLGGGKYSIDALMGQRRSIKY